jgi:SAM-dependent methyltransferase
VSFKRTSAYRRILEIEDAIELVQSKFPFKGYTNSQVWAYDNIARTVLRHLSPGAHLFDFGSGPCDKTAVLQLLGFVCSAYDDLQDEWHNVAGNRQKILEFTREIGIDFRLATDRSIPYESATFDMVMLHDVLEHLHDPPRDLLNDLVELIKPGGLLLVTVPNVANIRKRIDVMFGRTNLPRFDSYYWYPGPWRGHVREYTKGDLRQLAGFVDLEIFELRGCHHMLDKVPKMFRPLYLGVTGALKGWRDSWLLLAKKGQGWKPKRSLPPGELAMILRATSSYPYGTP